MPLWQFQETPKRMADKEMLNLQSRLGGAIGELVAGMDKAPAVKVAPNVFVTAKSPAKALQALVNLSGSDIHTVDHPADVQLLVDRLKAFTGGPVSSMYPGSQAAQRRA